MIDSLNSTTSMVVSIALDGLAQRQQLIASNLAHANSGSATIQDVDFETSLSRVLAADQFSGEDAMQALQKLKTDVSDGALIRRRPAEQIETDREMLRLNETVIRYQALVEGLGKYGSLARMAISGEVKP